MCCVQLSFRLSNVLDVAEIFLESCSNTGSFKTMINAFSSLQCQTIEDVLNPCSFLVLGPQGASENKLGLRGRDYTC